MWALCAALCFAPAAMAQPAARLAPQQAPQESETPNRVAVSSIIVAEIDSLPQAVRKEIDAQISRMSEKDLSSLRKSLSIMPAASSALTAKGKSVTNVVAAALATDGALLLVTTTDV
jgi:hypothetical protein